MRLMRLKEIREKCGFTQEELAKEAGVHLMTISLIERGATRPRAQTREKIERALGHSVDWIRTRRILEPLGPDESRHADQAVLKAIVEYVFRAPPDDVQRRTYYASTLVSHLQQTLACGAQQTQQAQQLQVGRD